MSTGPAQTLVRTRARRAPGGGRLALTVFGSSTTAGYGASDPARTGYAAILADTLAPLFPGGVALDNLGVSGECIEEMAPRVADVVASRPDLVIWQSGSNDAPRGVPPARFVSLMQTGIASIRGCGADLVLMEPQYCRDLEANPDFPPFLQAMRMLAATDRLPLYPRYQAMRDWARTTGLGIDGLSPDGTHMGDAGYALLGRDVAHFIQDRSSPV